MKSSRSLPALNESPAPCQSTTRTCSSVAAASSNSAMVTYMLDVIAFFFAGRFSWMLRMFPERSTAISFTVISPCKRVQCVSRSRDALRGRYAVWYRRCGRSACGHGGVGVGMMFHDQTRASLGRHKGPEPLHEDAGADTGG